MKAATIGNTMQNLMIACSRRRTLINGTITVETGGTLVKTKGATKPYQTIVIDIPLQVKLKLNGTLHRITLAQLLTNLAILFLALLHPRAILLIIQPVSLPLLSRKLGQ
jgi:hypothetical protein